MRRMLRPPHFNRAAARIVGQSQRYGANAKRPPPGRGAVPKSAAPRRTLSFHAPSFGIGIFTGALVVILFGYLPELLAPAPPLATIGETDAGAAKGTGSAEVQFVFDRVLKTPAPPVTTPSRADLAPADALGADATPVPTLQPGMVVGGDAPPPDAAASVPTDTPTHAGRDTPTPTDTASADAAEGTAPAAPTADLAAAPTADLAAAPTADLAAAPTADLATMQQDVESDRPPEAAPPGDADTGSRPRPGLLQAASFPERSAAERLRAELILLDLPASTGEILVGGKAWYRVTVGPFADVATAEAARERLRERNLTAIDVRQ
jgi:cell division protein FtsN